MDKTCETCRFWSRNSNSRRLSGQCRRYPPFSPIGWRVYSTGRGEMPFEIESDCAKFLSDAWPNTSMTAWCGEHQAKDSADDK